MSALVSIPVKWLDELLALCGPEQHELRARVMQSAVGRLTDSQIIELADLHNVMAWHYDPAKVVLFARALLDAALSAPQEASKPEDEPDYKALYEDLARDTAGEHNHGGRLTYAKTLLQRYAQAVQSIDLGAESRKRHEDAAEAVIRAIVWAPSAAISIDFKQVTDLLAMFGGEPTEVSLLLSEGHSGRGLYASYTEYPEEGSIYLGNADPEASPQLSASKEASKAVPVADEPKCPRCGDSGWVEEGDPELGGNKVPCDLCWSEETQAEEDAYVIQRMGNLLAQIAVAIRGPEPARRRWGYTDLPERVAELVAFRQAVLDPENQPSQFGTTLASQPEPTSKGAMSLVRSLTMEVRKLNKALELACGYLTEEQADEIAAAMPDASQQREPQEAGKVEAVADEAVAYVRQTFIHGKVIQWTTANGIRDIPEGTRLYLRPSQQALGEDAKDAARYRYLRAMWPMTILEDLMKKSVDRHPSAELDAAIDSILAAAGASEK